MNGRPTLRVCTAYPEVSKTAVLTPGQAQQLQLYSAHLLNRSGAAADLALLIKLSNFGWKFGQLVALSAPELTDQTAAIQGGSTENLFTLLNNDGFLIQSQDPFNLVGMSITQAQTGAPVYKYQYYNGVAYVDLPDVIATPSFAAVADTVLYFSKPLDWVPGSTAAVGGAANLYSIQCVATTAPTTAVQSNALWIGKNIHFQPQIPNNGVLFVDFGEKFPEYLNALEGLLPFFSVASPRNCVTAQYFSHN